MELIDSRQLRAFQVLAHCGSFTEAAKVLFLTQSAISHSIKSLEQHLNCRLFDRKGKMITLTSEGHSLLQRTERIIHEMQCVHRDIAATKRWGQGSLRIGATQSACQYFLPMIVSDFREHYPRCEVTIETTDTQPLLDKMSQGQIDVVFGLQQKSSTSVHFYPLFQDEIGFAVAKDHPWAETEYVPMNKMDAERYIIYQRASYTYRLMNRNFGDQFVSITELHNMEAIKAFAKLGLGVGILSHWLADQEVREGSLHFRSVESFPMYRQWGLYFPTIEALSEVESKFLDTCKTHTRSIDLTEQSQVLT